MCIVKHTNPESLEAAVASAAKLIGSAETVMLVVGSRVRGQEALSQARALVSSVSCALLKLALPRSLACCAPLTKALPFKSAELLCGMAAGPPGRF